MSSTSSRRDNDRPSDLTARARIRDTALQMFADHGYVGTTIRGIAQAAGVSSALVQHHFGNKESLRGVCDRYTIDFIRDQLAEAVTADGVGQPEYLDTVYRDAALPMRYLVQVMVDDSPSAASLFDELVTLTAQYLPELPDAPEDARRTRAAVLNSMHLGVLMMRGQLSRVLGVDVLSAEGFTVIGAAMLEVLDPDVTGPATHQLAHDGLARFRGPSQPTSPSQ